MIPRLWRPVPVCGQIRLGRPHDGGYLLPVEAATAADVLISMGLNTDWSFEEDYRRVRPSGRVVCFDHTVTTTMWAKTTVKNVLHLRTREVLGYWRYREFFAHPEISHRKTAIGYDGPTSVSLRTIMSDLTASNSVGLKIDIEGSEYRILDQIVTDRSRIAFVVIEFHDVDIHRTLISNFLESMRGFTVTWLHANNYGSVDPSGDPLFLEMSLVADRYALPTESPSATDALTTPNNPHLPELELRFG